VRDAGARVALTFDAGASPAPTPSILKTLRAAGIHATFFLTGKFCQKSPELVKEIHDEGHEIGNHTWSHHDMCKLTDAQMSDELRKMDDIVMRITGEHTAPYFRPPYGARNRHVLEFAAESGYKTIYWSLDSWDSVKVGITSEQISDRVLKRIQDGDIVLMHCGSQASADALPGMIKELSRRGIKVVTISELIH